MKDYIVVAVSPFYNGRGWTGQATGLDFDPATGIQAIRVDLNKHKDLSGIVNSIRLNNLLLLEGEIPEGTEASIESINPEELTKEQFKELVSRIKNKESGDDRVVEQLKADKAELQKEVAELKAKVAELSSVLEKSEESEPAVDEEPVEPVDLSAKTVNQLKAFAKENGIELTATKKDDIINEIEAQL